MSKKSKEQEELEKELVESRLYKKRYMIALYDKDDDLVDLFDNVAQIALNEGIDLQSKEYSTLKSRISSCVKKNCTLSTRFFRHNGVLVRPFLIDTVNENVDEEVLL